MTMIFDREVECCICGELSCQAAILSTKSVGSPALDTRPPEMQRSTICHCVQRCPSCDYCASDLSACETDASKIVTTDDYLNIIADTQMPEVATSFIALSHIQRKQGQFANATQQLIHASWICDDKNNKEGAVECRKRAISLISIAVSYGQAIADQAGVSEVIKIDLMRRTGMFREALELAEITRENAIEEEIIQIIKYEEKLIIQNDTTSHTISEAFGER